MTLQYLSGGRLSGVSGDTKPTDVQTNTIFIETDTQAQYLFDGSSWNTLGAAGGTNTVFGRGTDGDVTISSNTTLTEPKFYDDLTINSGVTLDSSESPMLIHCKGTCTINGTVSMTGKGSAAGVDGKNMLKDSGGKGGSGSSGGNGNYDPWGGGSSYGAPSGQSGQPGSAGSSGGSGGNAFTVTDDLSTDKGWVTSNSSDFEYNSSNDSIDLKTLRRNTTNQQIYIDLQDGDYLGSGNNLDDSTFTVRLGKIVWNTVPSGGGVTANIMLSKSLQDSGTNQYSINLQQILNSSEPITRLRANSNTNNEGNSTHVQSFSSTYTPNTSNTYRWEIVRDGNNFTANVYAENDTSYGTVLESKTVTASGITDLRYILITNDSEQTNSTTADMEIFGDIYISNGSAITPSTATGGSMKYAIDTSTRKFPPTYSNKVFEYGTGQVPAGANASVNVSPDGTKLYLSSNSASDSQKGYQYTLSTAYDISTASYASKSFQFGSQSADTRGLKWRNNGTYCYKISDQTGNKAFYRYTASTAYDISTLGSDQNYGYSSVQTGGKDLELSEDGTKMYGLADNATIYQYTLSTAWQVSSGVSSASKSFSCQSQDNAPRSFEITDSGTKLRYLGSQNDKIYTYTLSTAWDISTASHDDTDVSVNSTVGSDVYGLSCLPRSKPERFYVGGTSSPYKVYEFRNAMKGTEFIGAGGGAGGSGGKGGNGGCDGGSGNCGCSPGGNGGSGGAGGKGGGMIVIMAKKIIVASGASIISNGDAGTTGSSGQPANPGCGSVWGGSGGTGGSGGGGNGGYIYLVTKDYTNNGTVACAGGAGGGSGGSVGSAGNTGIVLQETL